MNVEEVSMYSQFMGSSWFTILSALLLQVRAVCLTASRSLVLVDIGDLDS